MAWAVADAPPATKLLVRRAVMPPWSSAPPVKIPVGTTGRCRIPADNNTPGKHCPAECLQPWLPNQPPMSPHPHLSLDTPRVTGFAVGGRGQRAHVPNVDYER